MILYTPDFIFKLDSARYLMLRDVKAPKGSGIIASELTPTDALIISD